MDPIIKQLSQLHKNYCASLETYVCPVNIKTACVARPEAWFIANRQVLLQAARAEYIRERVPGILGAWEEFLDIPDEARDILFARVVARYHEVAANGALTIPIKQGCCQLFKSCSLVRYQRSVLVAIRNLVKKEEDALTKKNES